MARGLRGRWTAALVAVAAGLTGLAAGDQALAVGGGTADASYGYVVKVSVGGDRGCTGVRLEPQLVLTAKACFPTGQATGAPAVATTVATRPDQGAAVQTVAVEHLFVRDDRNLVLLRLAKALTGLRGQVPLSVSGPAAGETLRVLGFGRTATEWVPDLPHTAQFSVGGVAGTDFGIAPTADGTVCKGDAGGPVIRENADGTSSLAGVLSGSSQGGCIRETSTARDATVTRVDGLAEWVNQFRDIELTGVVEAGAGGCLVLRVGDATYHLAGGDAAVVKAGATAHVSGYRAPAAGDTCAQGTRFRVVQAFPVVTLAGTVTRGAEGCLLLSSGATYQLGGGDPAVVKIGAAVSVTGYVAPGSSSCQQGTIFRVLSAVAAVPVSLRARVNNKFVTAEDAGAKPLIANRDTVGGTWEVFDQFDLGRGDIALRARVNGKFVTAESAGAAALIANRDTVGGTWERFQLVRNADGSVSLRAAVNGKYVTAENAGAAALIANRDTIGGSWERFDLINR
jgi:hypothetical protein